jgi:hypothetical protein
MVGGAAERHNGALSHCPQNRAPRPHVEGARALRVPPSSRRRRGVVSGNLAGYLRWWPGHLGGYSFSSIFERVTTSPRRARSFAM